MATTTAKVGSVLILAILITGWGQPPPAGSVLFPRDAGLIGYGVARNPSVAKRHALEDASANRFLSVRFETFQRGLGYAYSFDEFAIEDPLPSNTVTTLDSVRRADGLIHVIVAGNGDPFMPLPVDVGWHDVGRRPVEKSRWVLARGSHRAITGSEYRAYVLAKNQAVQAIVEDRHLSVRVMDQMTMTSFDRFAYLSTKAIIRGIRVLEVEQRADSTWVWIAIHSDSMTFYQ